ncbi:MAG: DEAD/DEAH box helicase, partial [Chloroflexota bacterium]
MSTVTFKELGVSDAVLRSVTAMGFEEPTPVQVRAIPLLMAGNDVVVQAHTGTGKTAAFGIHLVEQVDMRRAVPQAVVMVPTRELAMQVADQLSRLGHHPGLRLAPIYGGQPIDRQLRALQHGLHAIVATPGRLMDHMRRGSVALDAVKMLILDEADQMLDMGFQEDVEFVMSNLPEERLTALFSATMPQPILSIVNRYMRKPQILHLSKPQALTLPDTEQVFYEVPYPRKLDTLCRVLDLRELDRAIVFCATKRMVDDAVE